jgi:anti-sigma-K factor RskA
MTRDHSVIEELLAVQALGGLDGEDEEALRRERAAHGDCAECRALEAAYTDTAGMLPLALEPEPVDSSMADRIVGSDPGSDPGSDQESDQDDLARRRSGRAWRALVGAAAAFVLLVGGYAAFARGSGVATQATPAQQVVSFEGSGGDLKMLWEPGQPGALLWGSDMPDPGTGKTYEIWMISGAAAPVSGGCVSPTDGSMVAFVDADLAGTDTMAVTAEPDSCPGAPTSDPVLTASLPA